MNNPNPLLPQGSLNSQSKGKSTFRIAVFTILGIHVVLICGFLIFGCKPEPAQPEPVVTTEPTNEVVDTFEPFGSSDTAAPLPDPGTLPQYGEPTNGGISTSAQIPTGAAPTGGVSAIQPATPTNFTPQPSIPTTDIVTAPDLGVTPTTGETTIHVVAKGDMLSTIAQKYRISVRAIEDANPGVNPTRLQIGQKLNIPAPAVSTATSTAPTASGETTTSDYTTYTVKSGDVLERIAKNHKTTVSAIKSANGLKTDRINVGQKLKIPTAQ